MSLTERRRWVDRSDRRVSMAGQCRLLGLSRSGVYYDPAPESAEHQGLMRLLDQEYTRHPFTFGVCDGENRSFRMHGKKEKYD